MTPYEIRIWKAHVETCRCGIADLCECDCADCLRRNREALERMDREEKLRSVLLKLQEFGIDLEGLAELVNHLTTRTP